MYVCFTKIDAENTKKLKLQPELKQVEANMDMWQNMINNKQVEIEKIDPNAFVFMSSVKDMKGGMIKKRRLK